MANKYYGPNNGEGNPFFPDEKCVEFGTQKITSNHGSVFVSDVSNGNTFKDRLSNDGKIGGTMTDRTTGNTAIGGKKKGS